MKKYILIYVVCCCVFQNLHQKVFAMNRLTMKAISQDYYCAVLGLTECILFNQLRNKKSYTPAYLFEATQGSILQDEYTETKEQSSTHTRVPKPCI